MIIPRIQRLSVGPTGRARRLSPRGYSERAARMQWGVSAEGPVSGTLANLAGTYAELVRVTRGILVQETMIALSVPMQGFGFLWGLVFGPWMGSAQATYEAGRRVTAGLATDMPLVTEMDWYSTEHGGSLVFNGFNVLGVNCSYMFRCRYRLLESVEDAGNVLSLGSVRLLADG